MSTWTHVGGCIRVDGLGFLGGPESKLLAQFGTTCTFDDPREKWNACTAPCGSEGSVQYRIVQTGRDNSLAWGLVYIWGDLRDYDDMDEIYKWLVKGCAGQMIRSCAVLIDVEDGRRVVVIEDDNELIMVDLEG